MDAQFRCGRIYIVDDTTHARETLAALLSLDDHEFSFASNGPEALEGLEAADPDVVLLDVMMPGMDGFEVTRRIRAEPKWRRLPIILVTALDQKEDLVRGLDAGADEFLSKPVNGFELRARVRTMLRLKRQYDEIAAYSTGLEQQVEAQVKEISDAQLAMIFALSKLAESRDPETGEHLERMREYCRAITLHLRTLTKYSDVVTEAYAQNLYAASALHDIGKVGVPDHILLKPGQLTPEEFDEMKRHTLLGESTLRAVDAMYPGNGLVRMGIEIAATHHEKWDGSGYPHGLRGEEIPLCGRILALGDVYDALTSKRCYKPAFPHEKARAIILEGRGSHFDPEIVDAFEAIEDRFVEIRLRFQDAEVAA